MHLLDYTVWKTTDNTEADEAEADKTYTSWWLLNLFTDVENVTYIDVITYSGLSLN